MNNHRWLSLAEAMAIIDEYEAIDPEIAKRIREMWKLELEHRRKINGNYIL